ncbi:MAG: response regulator [Bacteriovoracia bacterium]
MKNIMVVEDDDDIRDVLESVLSDEGYLVNSFESLPAASDWLAGEEARPDLILLDFMFPQGNSSNFLAALQLRANRVPVLLMSAGNSVILGGDADRADGFISKPIQIDTLLGEIGKWVSHGQSPFGPCG